MIVSYYRISQLTLIFEPSGLYRTGEVWQKSTLLECGVSQPGGKHGALFDLPLLTALSVSTSQTMSPAEISSPACLPHVPMFPCVIVGESAFWVMLARGGGGVHRERSGQTHACKKTIFVVVIFQ